MAAEPKYSPPGSAAVSVSAQGEHVCNSDTAAKPKSSLSKHLRLREAGVREYELCPSSYWKGLHIMFAAEEVPACYVRDNRLPCAAATGTGGRHESSGPGPALATVEDVPLCAEDLAPPVFRIDESDDASRTSSSSMDQYSALDRDPVAVRLTQLEMRIAELEVSRERQGDTSDSCASGKAGHSRTRRSRRRRPSDTQSRGRSGGLAATAAAQSSRAAVDPVMMKADDEIQYLKSALAKAEAERDEARAKLAAYEKLSSAEPRVGTRSPPALVLATIPRAASAPPMARAGNSVDASARTPLDGGTSVPRGRHQHRQHLREPWAQSRCQPPQWAMRWEPLGPTPQSGQASVPAAARCAACSAMVWTSIPSCLPQLSLYSLRSAADGDHCRERTPNGFGD